MSFTAFSGGNRSQFRRFEAWANGEVPDLTTTFLNYPNDVTRWYAKSAPDETKSSIEAAYSDGLNDCVIQVIALYDDCTDYATAKEILRLFNTLGILSDVNNRMQAYRRDANMLFLSDTKELLNKIIADSESPFIYEKIGSRLNHFMIDEFQDTSTMQWNNFRPLLQESLASGCYNLIVGDVKQSIYRWRNSDWRLLEEQIEEDFSAPNIQQHVLETNWRSDGNVVTFNNNFFKHAATVLQAEYVGTDEEIQDNEYYSTKIESAYSQVSQNIAPIREADAGRVSINFIEQEKGVKWNEESLEQLPFILEKLQDDGFQLKDIAILVRKGKEAVAVSERLLQYKDDHPDSEYKYDFISNEALLLTNSSCVKAVVALLQYINSPHEKTIQVRAIYEYYRFTTKMNASDIFDNYVQQYTDDLPDELKQKLVAVLSLPLYELAEALFELVKEATAPTDTVYIQAFLDLINEYSARKTADLNGFLMWWDEVKEKKSLFSPDNQDAIQLMTIHKSKGLQFGAVILPFVNWTFEPDYQRAPIMWCKPKVAPFNDLGVVPVKYNKKLASTIFKQEYLEEKLYSFIDNLNLLYVAFTRPKHRLIVTAPKPKNLNAIKNVSDLLWHSVNASVLSKTTDEVVEVEDSEGVKQEKLSFNYGEAKKLDKSHKKDEKDVEDEAVLTSWQSTPFRNRLKMRLSGIGYFSDDGTRNFGTLMHEIVSEIHTLDDLDGALEKRVLSGELTIQEKQDLFHELFESLSLPQVQDWYSSNYRVLNEQQVLHPTMNFIRPDRVMIKDDKVVIVDYKFGESIESKYVKQVQNYARSIRSMGYANVEGYLFYVKLHKVVKV